MRHIDETARIGKGTKVWQFASVIRDARIGRDCSIGSCAIVDGAIIGDGCRIGHGAQVHPGAAIGHGVFIGPGSIICNDAWPRIHKENFNIGAYSDRPCVVIGDFASIGANCTVLPGVRIGGMAMVAAGMVVSRDIPSCHLLTPAGVPVPIESDIAHERMKFAGKAMAR